MRRFPNPPNDGNPFGQFNSLTSAYGNKFNNAFVDNKPMIERPDYRNKNNFIHNNVGEELLLEQLTEYYLNIDSRDRDVSSNPNPFSIVVNFGGSAKSVERRHNSTIAYNGTPGPIIDRKFSNVKFIKLDYVILPNYHGLEDVSTNCVLTDVSDYKLTSHRFLLIRIKELGCERILSTNPVQSDDTFLLYPDKFMGDNYTMWLPTFGARIFPTSKLFNLSRLTLEILDPDGNLITVWDVNNNSEINFRNLSNYGPQASYVRESCNSLGMNLAFIVGTIENEFNTNIKYEK
jgi:hypothetical protein